MNDRLIKMILDDEYFSKKPKNKFEKKPLPPVFNPRPKFFVFNKISKQTPFLNHDELREKNKKENEEDYFGLVNPEKIISNELNTIKVYQSQKIIEKKPTFLKKPTKAHGLIDLEDNYLNDSRYFEEKK
jgi:hypothetical protein